MEELLYNIHVEQVIKDCLFYPFPGTINWPANNPIWDCYIQKRKISPKDAWNQEKYIRKAVENLYKITQFSIYNNKYKKFTDNIEYCFKEAYENDNFLPLARAILTRFTVAKIAPKVTALKSSDFLRILNETNIDISNGIYCPMAGFGGIIEGAKKWFKQNKLEEKIEAYDINQNFCDYYGWINRDILAQKIITNKIVFACPPFGENTERWKGTPDNMYYDFHTWCKLIKEYIKAPNYILIGPEISSDKNSCGLFSKKFGIQYYPEYSICNSIKI